MTAALVAAEASTAVAVATAQDGLRADIGVGAALVLALLFAGTSIRASLGGQRLTCACFGSLRPAQALGWHTLVRVSLATLGREVAELVPDPPAPVRLDPARPNYVLVLSNTCSACHTIGSGLASSKPPWVSALTVLVASDSERGGNEFAASIGLDSPRLLIDNLGRYAKQLGVDSSPTIVKVENGRLAAAANLSSLRQLELFVAGPDLRQ